MFSFLQQDYPGIKELVILNDYHRQRLRFDHSEVRVVNLAERFRTVGEKMNAAAALCSHDLVFVWDDDDIYLPHRISFSVERFDAVRGYFTTQRAWLWDDGVLTGPCVNVFHSGSCWSRRLFDLVNGYAAMGNGYDQEIERQFEQACPGSTAPFPVRPDEVFYIYRWGGTQSYHMSSFGRDTLDRNVEQQAVAEYVAERRLRGELRLGEIDLAPRWATDYGALVRAVIEQQSAAQPGEMSRRDEPCTGVPSTPVTVQRGLGLRQGCDVV